MVGFKLAVAVNLGFCVLNVYIYSSEPGQNQGEEEAEQDGNWSRLDPFPQRRWELQQGCRDAHVLCDGDM